MTFNMSGWKPAPVLVFLVAAVALSGCASWTTSRVVLNDGNEVLTVPNCVRNGMLETSDEAIQLSTVSEIKSHAGNEYIILGGTLMAAGAGLIIWWVTDSMPNDARLAVGSVLGGLGLVNVITGLLFNRLSAGALNRTCSPRRP